MYCCIHGSGASLLAEMFSPFYEVTAPETAVFDAGRLERLAGGIERIARSAWEKSGRNANVAMAATPDAAVLAARNFPGITIVRDAAATLADLPLDALPIDQADIFAAWGIRTLGDLAALPETGLAERMGMRAVELQRMARGAIQRPLQIRKPDEIYADRIELEHPVELLEPLLFLIARILNERCAKLVAHGLAASEIRIELTNYTRTLHLPVPMRDSRALLKLLQTELEAHPPEEPMSYVALALKPVEPRRFQHGMFIPQAPAPDRLELTLARIRGLVGAENVGIPELIDTWRPAPFRLVNVEQAFSPAIAQAEGLLHFAFRYFHPPITATVHLERARPARIAAPGIHGGVMSASGPWRTSGEWWTCGPWDRDEWDVALNDGALYRLYRESEWFIEGVYD